MSYSSLSRAKRVSNGRSVAKHPRRGVFLVVVHQVVVYLRTNEKSAPGVEFQSCADLSHEMRAGRVVRARDVVTSVVIGVEACALGTDAGGEFCRHVLGELRHVDPVEVPEDRAVGLICIVDPMARL